MGKQQRHLHHHRLHGGWLLSASPTTTTATSPPPTTTSSSILLIQEIMETFIMVVLVVVVLSSSSRTANAFPVPSSSLQSRTRAQQQHIQQLQQLHWTSSLSSRSTVPLVDPSSSSSSSSSSLFHSVAGRDKMMMMTTTKATKTRARAYCCYGRRPSTLLCGRRNNNNNNNRATFRKELRSTMLYLSSSSEITATTTTSNDTKGPSTSSSSKLFFSRRILTARIALLLTIFGIGYQIGKQQRIQGGYKSFLLSQLSPPSRSTILPWTILFIVFVRNIWINGIPQWARLRLIQRAISDTAILLGLKKKKKKEGTTTTISNGDNDDDTIDDIANFDILFGKLGAVVRVFQEKLFSSEQSQQQQQGTTTTIPFNVKESFFALLRLQQKSKRERLSYRDEIYSSAGIPATMDDIDPLIEYMEYADWAYDEVDGMPLKELLDGRGYSLIKHDKTNVPGYIGHYVAIPKNPSTTRKVALVGIKGTSGIEDVITDMCGATASYELDRPYIKGSNVTTIRAHDGILIGTRRLANDIQPLIENLLLPMGYQIVVVGHSLGAAAGAILSIILRSQIPSLQQYDDYDDGRRDDGAGGIPSNRSLQVYAFASPPILDVQNALSIQPFVTTVVNEADIITRSNVGTVTTTVEILKKINTQLYTNNNNNNNKKDRTRVEKRKSFIRRQFQRLGRAISRIVRTTKKSDDDGDDDADSNTVDDERIRLLNDTNDLQKAILDATTSSSNLSVDDDYDNLYVPGKVILMYNEWGGGSSNNKGRTQETTEGTTTPTNTTTLSSATPISNEEEEEEEEEDDSDIEEEYHDDVDDNNIIDIPDYAANKAVICNGTASPLRYIEFDTRMVFDHSTLEYKQSLQSVLLATTKCG